MAHPHPLQRWLDAKGVDYDWLCAKLASRGKRLSPTYLRTHIIGRSTGNADRHPGYKLAELIAEITGNAVTTKQLKSYPLKA